MNGEAFLGRSGASPALIRRRLGTLKSRRLPADGETRYINWPETNAASVLAYS